MAEQDFSNKMQQIKHEYDEEKQQLQNKLTDLHKDIQERNEEHQKEIGVYKV